MNGHILVLSGNIQKNKGETFNKEDVFKVLEDAGFEFTGLLQIVSYDEMNDVINEIVDYIGADEVKAMLITHNNIYGENCTYGDMKECLLYNTGTSAFYDIITCSLSKELTKKFDKYSKTNWEVSDDFEALLSNKLVKKIDTLI